METSLAEDVKKPTRTLSPDSFFFMSPYRSFTTSGCFRRFSQPAVGGDALNGEFQQQMAAAFAEARAAGIRKPVMVGAIPFDTCQPSELYIPERWEAFSRPEKQRSARYAAPLEAMEVVERREIPEQDAFLAMVERAAALTATPEVDKVVLSRLIDITTRDRVDSGALMERLIAQNPASFNFHVPLSDGGVLLGAGGLVRAYTQGAVVALKAAQVVEMLPSCQYLCEVAYPLWDKVQYALKSLPVQLLSSEFTTAVGFTLLIRQTDAQSVLDTLTRVTDGRIETLLEEESYRAWDSESK